MYDFGAETHLGDGLSLASITLRKVPQRLWLWPHHRDHHRSV